MGGNTLFEGPGSDRDTVTYRTYDERPVSRDEIEQALGTENGGTWQTYFVIVATLGVLLIAVIVAVIWLSHT